MQTLSRVISFVMVLFLQSLCGFAQQPPLMGSEASATLPDGSDNQIANTPPKQETPYRILVIGDALAGGLGAGMARMAEADPSLEIINRFNEASGLARTAVYDWPSALQKIAASNPVDAVVVLVGVNDRQEIRQGNVRFPFKSPEWLKGYTDNVDRLVAAAKAADATLFWISIPPMENAMFDADMRYLTELHQQRVAAAKGHFVDVRRFFLTADGRYIDRGADDTGTDRKLRSRDGVTFFKQGNNRFGQIVLNAVKAEVGKGAKPLDVATAEPEPTAIPLTKAAEQAVAPPSFGQLGPDGEQLGFRADSVVQMAQKAPQTQQAPAGTSAPRSVAKAGSAAQQLIELGVFGIAPEGRFDDYIEPKVP